MDPILSPLAEWTSALTADDIPERTARRAGSQWASVLGSVLAVADHPASQAIGRVARRTGGAGPCTLLPDHGAVAPEPAVWGNAGRSMLLDYDDYLFAGHTGHSAVLVTLALGELLDSPGPDLLAATVAANEVGGRLGAAMLLGPHNGQMWAYIHELAGAAAAARLLGLDAAATASAMGLAMTQPPYPLPATFMGSDGKALTASGPAVEGLRAALLAAEGLECATDPLADRSGFFARVHPGAMTGMFSGYGSAWLTDSLSYKVYPGCAYLDTAVDAAGGLLRRVAEERGRPLRPEEVEAAGIKAGTLTVGMEQMSGWYRGPGSPLREINVTFSAAYSVAITLIAGRLTAAELHPGWWRPRSREIEDLAGRIEVSFDDAMNDGMRTPAGAGFDLAATLRRPADEPLLDGASFASHESRFPATVELRLTDGSVWRETCEVPLGGAGRPEAETRELVRAKLEGNGAAARSFDALEHLAGLASARQVAELVRDGAPSGPAPRAPATSRAAR